MKIKSKSLSRCLVEAWLAKRGGRIVGTLSLTPALSRWERENDLSPSGKTVVVGLMETTTIGCDIRQFPSPSGRGIKGEGERLRLPTASKPRGACRRHESGLATMVFVILLAIMMILVMAESRALFHLNRETKFLEQQQIKRLNGPVTNTMPTSTTEKK